MAEIAIFLLRQKKRIIAASGEAVISQFLRYDRLLLESGIVHICTFSMVYLLH